MTEVYANAVKTRTASLLTQPILADDLVLPTLGAVGDDLQAGEFRIVVIDPVEDRAELMMVTSGQETAQWHVDRGIEGTTPIDFPELSIIKHIWTVGSMGGLIDSSVERVFVADSGGHFETLIGNGSASSFSITHNLNMKFIQVNLINVSTNEAEDCLVTYVDVNTVAVSADAWIDNPPATGSYRVICDSPSGIMAGLATSMRGQPNGFGSLDGTAHQPISEMPTVAVVDSSGTSPPSGTHGLEVLREAPMNLMDKRWAGGAANDGSSNQSAALLAAWNAIPNNGSGRVYLPQGAGYVFNDLYFNGQTDGKSIEIFGDGQGSVLKPGVSGKILHVYAMQTGHFQLNDLCLIQRLGSSANTTDYLYSNPLINIEASYFLYKRLTGQLRGTGTMLKILGSYDGNVLQDSKLQGGEFGVPVDFEVENGPNDTLGFTGNMMAVTNFAYIVRNGHGWGLMGPRFINEKINAIGPNATTLIDDTLTADAHVGDSVIHVANAAAWQTALTARGGPIPFYIEGTYAGFTNHLANDTEVNKVISADTGAGTINVRHPLMYDHLTNGGTYHVQVICGAVAITLGGLCESVVMDGLHLEGHSIGIMAGSNVTHLSIDNLDNGGRRVLRIPDYISNLKFGQHKLFGPAGGSENVVIDIPSWNTNSLPIRNGRVISPIPWTAGGGTLPPTVLKGGVSHPVSDFLDLYRPHAAKAGIPTDADFLGTQLTDGLTVTDTTNGALWIRTGGVWKSLSKQSRLRALLNGSFTVVRERVPHEGGAQTNIAGVSALTLGLGIPLLAGDSIGHVAFSALSATAFGSDNNGHWWVAIYDASGDLILQSADQGTTAIGNGTTPKVALAGGPYVPTADVLVYAMAMIYPGTGGSPATSALNASNSVNLSTLGAAKAGVTGNTLTSSFGTAPPSMVLAASVKSPYFALVT